MIKRSFASVGWVATIAGAALGCYMVSLRVASERAALDEVESRIVAAQRDIRLLQTEIGTRGRLAQLERWNARVLALSAPRAEQFLEGSFALARLANSRRRIDLEAPVVLAAAPAPRPARPLAEARNSDARNSDALAPEAATPGQGTAGTMLHSASLATSARAAPARPDQPRASEPRPNAAGAARENRQPR